VDRTKKCRRASINSRNNGESKEKERGYIARLSIGGGDPAVHARRGGKPNPSKRFSPTTAEGEEGQPGCWAFRCSRIEKSRGDGQYGASVARPASSWQTGHRTAEFYVRGIAQSRRLRMTAAQSPADGGRGFSGGCLGKNKPTPSKRQGSGATKPNAAGGIRSSPRVVKKYGNRG